MILTVTEVCIQLGKIFHRLLNTQFFRDTIGAERDREVRVILYRLTIAVDRAFDAGSIGHFKGVIQAL